MMLWLLVVMSWVIEPCKRRVSRGASLRFIALDQQQPRGHGALHLGLLLLRITAQAPAELIEPPQLDVDHRLDQHPGR